MVRWAVVAGVIAIAATALAQAGLPGELAGYINWSRANADRVNTPGAHPASKDIYFNTPVARAVRDGKFVYPFAEGTIIVKERTDPATLTVTTLYTMRKVAGFDPATGNWQYGVFERKGSGSFQGAWFGAAQQQMCVGCHVQAKNQDYVFVPFTSRR